MYAKFAKVYRVYSSLHPGFLVAGIPREVTARHDGIGEEIMSLDHSLQGALGTSCPCLGLEPAVIQ